MKPKRPKAVKAPDLVAELDRFANIEAPLACWLDGGEADAGLSYCRECAEKAVAAGKGETVDGGYRRYEEDGCCHCETCGRVLNYWLTECGVESELAHFKRHMARSTLLPGDAFHIARLVECAPDNRAAVRIGERAVALIPAPKPRKPK